MAGAEGFEPSTKVLETHVLPLHHAPTFFRTEIIIHENSRYVNRRGQVFTVTGFVNFRRTIERLLCLEPSATAGIDWDRRRESNPSDHYKKVGRKTGFLHQMGTYYKTGPVVLDYHLTAASRKSLLGH